VHEAKGQPASESGDGGFQPTGHAGGVPVQNNCLEERPAYEHYQPIPVECRPHARGWNIVKIPDTEAKPQPDCLEAKEDQEDELSGLKTADLLDGLRQARVDVIAIDAVGRDGIEPTSSIASKTGQHELHHAALAMMGWWGLSKNEEFHGSELQPN
jgi:hypothetical protein